MSIYAIAILFNKTQKIVCNEPMDKKLYRQITTFSKESYKEIESKSIGNNAFLLCNTRDPYTFICAYKTEANLDRANKVITHIQSAYQLQFKDTPHNKIPQTEIEQFQKYLNRLISDHDTGIENTIARNLNEKAQGIKENLLDATRKQIENNEEATRIEDNANEMKNEAKVFLKNTDNIKEMAKKQAMCCYCSIWVKLLLILLAAGIIALIIIYFIKWRN